MIKLVCDDGQYDISKAVFSVGTDADCTNWKTLDIDTSSIGRMLPYERTKDLVHTADYTNYNIHLNAANPQLYSVTLEYDDKDIDYNIFDSGDNAQLRLLYGQCYQLSYKEILSGDEVQSSRVCADDVIFKESILSSTRGLIFWSSPWGATHTYNNTSLILDTIVRHLPVNYDYNVRITDKNDLVIVNANVTSPQEVSSQSYNLTAYDANKPFHLSIYNSEDKRIYQAYLDDRPQYLKPVADLFAEHSFAGWNLLMFAPLIFAAMFTRNTAGIGAGLTAAFIAFVNWIGIIDISTTIVGLIIVIGALGVIAYRKQFD